MTNKPTWEEIDKYLRLNCSIRMFGLLGQSPDDEITNKDYRYLVSLVLRVLNTKLAEQRKELIEKIEEVYVGYSSRTEGRDDSYDDAFLDGTEVMQSKVINLLKQD